MSHRLCKAGRRPCTSKGRLQRRQADSRWNAAVTRPSEDGDVPGSAPSAGTSIVRVGVEPQGGGGIAKLYSASQKPVLVLQTSKAGEGGEVAVAGDVSGQVARIGGNGDQLSLRFYSGSELAAGMGTIADGGI